MRYEFEAEVWRWKEDAAWHFVTLPADCAEGLKALRGRAPGFGSIRVRVETGGTAWRTSLFPDRRSGSFLLPLKADVRRREGLEAGRSARFAVEMEI